MPSRRVHWRTLARLRRAAPGADARRRCCRRPGRSCHASGAGSHGWYGDLDGGYRDPGGRRTGSSRGSHSGRSAWGCLKRSNFEISEREKKPKKKRGLRADPYGLTGDGIGVPLLSSFSRTPHACIRTYCPSEFCDCASASSASHGPRVQHQRSGCHSSRDLAGGLAVIVRPPSWRRWRESSRDSFNRFAMVIRSKTPAEFCFFFPPRWPLFLFPFSSLVSRAVLSGCFLPVGAVQDPGRWDYPMPLML